MRMVPDYEIEERHNMSEMAKQRAMIFDHAWQCNYDAVWFVDTDILPEDDILDAMLNCVGSVVAAPYRVKWLQGVPTILLKKHGMVEPLRCSVIKNFNLPIDCFIAGFGCTLVRRTAFNVRIENKSIIINDDTEVHGDDVGFFLNCSKRDDLIVQALPGRAQPHLYDRHKQ